MSYGAEIPGKIQTVSLSSVSWECLEVPEGSLSIFAYTGGPESAEEEDRWNQSNQKFENTSTLGGNNSKKYMF